MSATLPQRLRALARTLGDSPWLALRRKLLRNRSPAPLPPFLSPENYPQWLDARIAARATKYSIPARPGQFSFLTGVYERTPAGIFQETVESVRAQTSRHFEWIILAHGPVTSELDSALIALATDSRVRIIRLPQNLGIMGGMKKCLEEATGQYVIPLDADDLLTPDALTILASELARTPSAFIYSDEDSLVGGVPKSPYFRSDWDPLLNLSSSYIFHLVAFNRPVGIEAGLYDDAGSNWCHDWDTVFRFATAGHTPTHIPEVLYHWRAHAGSHTNTTDPHQGSLQSQHHVLEKFLATRRDSRLFEIKPFPIFRGAQEWWLSRKPIEPQAIDLIQIGDGSPAGSDLGGFAVARSASVADLKTLAHSISQGTAPLTVIFHEQARPTDPQWAWEAMGLFDLHDKLDVIAGRIINPDRIVLGGPEKLNADRQIQCPFRGLVMHEPGEMALALKPHCVQFANTAFFIARTEFLRRCLLEIPAELPLHLFGPWLSTKARQSNRMVGYSPLVNAHARAGFDCPVNSSAEELTAFGVIP